MAMVDSELWVQSIDDLRVVDASVKVNTNTNAGSKMIGEKATDLLLGWTTYNHAETCLNNPSKSGY